MGWFLIVNLKLNHSRAFSTLSPGRTDMVTWDELGYSLYSQASKVLLFHQLGKLCKKTIIIIKLKFSAWTSIFGDSKIIAPYLIGKPFIPYPRNRQRQISI